MSTPGDHSSKDGVPPVPPVDGGGGRLSSSDSNGGLPTMTGAFAGLWTLTWRSRFTLRQVPLLALTVLFLPTLAYLAVSHSHGARMEFFARFVSFYLFMALPLYCLAVLGDLIRDELQSNTLAFLITRPVTRARLVFLKFLCAWIWVECVALASGSLLLLAGRIAGAEDAFSAAPIILGAQFLAVLAYGALSALLGLLHRRYLVVGAIYGLVVEVGIGQIPTNVNTLSINRHLRTILANNTRFQEIFDWSNEKTWLSVLILIAAGFLFCGLASLMFTLMEYHHSEEMQK